MSNIQSLQWKSGVKWFCLSTLTKSIFKSHNIIFNTNLMQIFPSGRLNHWKEIKLCILHFDETGQENCKQTRLRTKQPIQEKSLQLDSISCSITSNMNLANNLSMYEVLFVHLAENFNFWLERCQGKLCANCSKFSRQKS